MSGRRNFLKQKMNGQQLHTMFSPTTPNSNSIPSTSSIGTVQELLGIKLSNGQQFQPPTMSFNDASVHSSESSVSSDDEESPTDIKNKKNSKTHHPIACVQCRQLHKKVRGRILNKIFIL